MSRHSLDLIAQEFLSQIELKESSLLSWGFLGGKFPVKFTMEEITNNLPTQLLKHLWTNRDNEITIDAIISNLKDRKLLFIDGSGFGRTRFAETVRLIFLLKQRFSFSDWQSAPTLVSNVKLHLAYRKYPRRNLYFSDFKQNVLDAKLVSDHSLTVLSKLLVDNDNQIALSQFQVDSIFHLLSNVKNTKDIGTIIGAGTGSGKTKAFYIPALLYITDRIQRRAGSEVKILSLYPRIELLKDQLRESLLEINKINDVYQQLGLRKIVIGAYYGDTPPSASDVVDSKHYKWQKEDLGYICPYLLCQCESRLIWSEQQITAEIEDNKNNKFGNHEQLVCPRCNYQVKSDNIRLTRKSIYHNPPDILFTSFEMLNRKLFDSSDRHVFGINQSPPKFVLLDETHTYSGNTGAHVAHVLRRWRHLTKLYSSNKSIQYVGLSATLTNPKSFFANLTGIEEHKITYICPKDEDLEAEGMEYNLVVRGDPVSATALLSTTVQISMLLGRMLDPIGNNLSNGAYGSKIFGFTDKLDVINRWYHIQRDSEDNKLLSQYRDENRLPAELNKKILIENGQVWHFASRIDSNYLITPMNIDITSSQYRGVDPRAKLVIATSTLEVGYNDKHVGAVIQHKAPRDIASFIQRKGRSGRERDMRPWTIVITSAYGRDRWAYENSERLFDPQLPALPLPIKSTYIQHIQASFAFMDWLCIKLRQRGFKYVNNWWILSPGYDADGQLKKAIISALKDLLDGNISEFSDFLQSSLSLDQTALNQVLWSPPRSILLDLIPTLMSKFETSWTQTVKDNNIINIANTARYPLPGYVPMNLFSGLEIKDIEMKIPGRDEPEYLSLVQGMFEFCPGNVSKRYAFSEHLSEAHWVPLGGSNEFELNNSHIKAEIIKSFTTNGNTTHICSPRQFEIAQIPREISDRSRASLVWNTDIESDSVPLMSKKGRSIDIVEDSFLGDFICSIDAYLNEESSPVFITRYAKNFVAEEKRRGQEVSRWNIRFTLNGEPAAIGYQIMVDALSFKCTELDLHNLFRSKDWSDVGTYLRSRYCVWLLKENELLSGTLSVFEIEWLWQVCICSILHLAIIDNITLEEAFIEYRNDLRHYSQRTLDTIFQVNRLVSPDENQEEGRVHQRILSYIDDPTIMDEVIDTARFLHIDVSQSESFLKWSKCCCISSIAAALRLTIEELMPDINTDNLLIDIQYDDGTIWVSENDSGGIGIISSIVGEIETHFHKFERTFMFLLDYCSRHEMSQSMDAVLQHIDDDVFNTLFSEIRTAQLLEEQQFLLIKLQKLLSSQGIVPKREIIITLLSKLLNANSNEHTDKFLATIRKMWKSEEKRLNCEIDSRTFGVALVQIPEIQSEIDAILSQVIGSENIDARQRMSFIDTLLWSDCLNSCPDCLHLSSPYQTFIEPSRLLMRLLRRTNYEIVEYGNQWKEQLNNILQSGKTAKLKVPINYLSLFHKEILDFVLTPIDLNFELLYPFTSGYRQHGSDCYIDISLREEVRE